MVTHKMAKAIAKVCIPILFGLLSAIVVMYGLPNTAIDRIEFLLGNIISIVSTLIGFVMTVVAILVGFRETKYVQGLKRHKIASIELYWPMYLNVIIGVVLLLYALVWGGTLSETAIIFSVDLCWLFGLMVMYLLGLIYVLMTLVKSIQIIMSDK